MSETSVASPQRETVQKTGQHTPGPWRLGREATSVGHLVYVPIKHTHQSYNRMRVTSTINAKAGNHDTIATAGVYAHNPDNGRTLGETYKDELGDKRVKPFISEEECRANARLIAAAPELLEALKTLYEETADYIRINNLGDVHHNISMQKASAAIAKATGGDL